MATNAPLLYHPPQPTEGNASVPEKKRFFASPQDAEAAFYDSLERADMETMMSVWTDEEEVVCIHPGGVRISGYANVMESWRQILGNGPRLRVRLSHQVHLQGLLLSIHSLHENITLIEDDTPRPPIVATNIYLRGAQGWRMLVHHASPAPAPPEIVSDTPKTLH